MTSLERRRAKRRERRMAARAEKKRLRYAEYDCYENIISYNALYLAYRKSMANVAWKASVQRYQMSFLRNIHDTHNDLAAERDITKGFVEFNTLERGKIRHIRSVHFSERVVQKSTSDNALVPMLSRSLIYDNGACLPGKGVDRALNRLDVHLRKFYRENGFSNEGYIVLFDFTDYFGSILHSICLQLYNDSFDDKRIYNLLYSFVFPFGYPFASSNWRRKKHEAGDDGYTGKSLGLGSQISQVTAVTYPNRLDHYIKEVLRVKGYGRYMDDGYMIFRTKEEAKAALEKVNAFCETLGIVINQRKTQITRIDRDFVFLKVKHRLTETGKAMRYLSRSSVTRQRRKLKKLYAKYVNGEIPIEDIRQAYGSWKGHALHRNARESVRNMDRLYSKLFKELPPTCKLE